MRRMPLQGPNVAGQQQAPLEWVTEGAGTLGGRSRGRDSFPQSSSDSRCHRINLSWHGRRKLCGRREVALHRMRGNNATVKVCSRAANERSKTWLRATWNLT
jgi:hypothetical protein